MDIDASLSSHSGNANAKIALNVTEEDVRRGFSRAVQHRLRVVEGPRHEVLASLCFPSVNAKQDEPEWVTGRRQIRDIVREIVDSV